MLDIFYHLKKELQPLVIFHIMWQREKRSVQVRGTAGRWHQMQNFCVKKKKKRQTEPQEQANKAEDLTEKSQSKPTRGRGTGGGVEVRRGRMEPIGREELWQRGRCRARVEATPGWNTANKHKKTELAPDRDDTTHITIKHRQNKNWSKGKKGVNTQEANQRWKGTEREDVCDTWQED